MTSVLRKEIKYLISRIEFLRLKKHLDLLMKKDTHGIDGKYMIRSQYYDSIRDQDLNDNLDGIMEKRKIRLRTYSFDAKMIKLEYKCKSGTDGSKHFVWVTRDEALMMERGKYDFLLYHDEDLANILYLKMIQGGYKAKTIIQYNRNAYFYPVNDVRITFDTDLKSTINPYGLFTKDRSFVPLMTADCGILEVKYNNFLPSIFKELLQEIDSLSEASSKYSMARINN